MDGPNKPTSSTTHLLNIKKEALEAESATGYW